MAKKAFKDTIIIAVGHPESIPILENRVSKTKPLSDIISIKTNKFTNTIHENSIIAIVTWSSTQSVLIQAATMKSNIRKGIKAGVLDGVKCDVMLKIRKLVWINRFIQSLCVRY
jgi:hypothetical protein